MKLLKILNITVLALCILLIAGLATVFAPCGAREDGSFMNCHYAAMGVQAAAAVIAVLAISALLLKGGAHRGLFLAMLPIEVFAVLIPGIMVKLCMMPDMRCRMFMRPFAVFMLILVFVLTMACVLAAGKKQQGTAAWT